MDYAIKIIEQSGRELTDYQVKVEITDPDFFSKCTDQKFVEFYDEDKQTLLPHYTELFDTANKIAIFWVKVPSITANGTKFIYLNINTERTEDLSDPSKVFDLWDDFITDTIASGKWQVVAGEWIIETENSLIWNDDNQLARIKSQFNDIGNFIYELKLRHDETEGFSWAGIEIKSPSMDYDQYDEGYMILHYGDTGAVRILRADSGSLTELASATKSIPQGEWFILKVIYADGTIKVLIDDEFVVQATDNTYQSGEVVRVWNNDTAQKTSFDYIRVRKYTEPEPSVTVVKLGATPTYDLKLKIAQALAGEAITILDTDPKIRLLSGTDIIKELSLTAKTVYKDSVNNRVVVAFLFVDDSSDSYTTDNQELLFTKDNTEYVAFKSSKTFTKEADKRLPLRWEIYLPYDVDVCTYEETMISCL